MKKRLSTYSPKRETLILLAEITIARKIKTPYKRT